MKSKLFVFTSQKFKTLLNVLIYFFFLSGCVQNALDLPAVSSATISGKIVDFNSSNSMGVSSMACNSPTAQLFKIDDNGNRVESALASSQVSSDGSYSFSTKTSGVSLKGQTPTDSLIVIINGCSSGVYFRPLTGAKDQNVTMGSTVLSYLLNTDNKSNLASALKNSPSQLNDLINSLQAAATLSAAYNILANDSSANAKFISLFGTIPTVLNQAAPEILTSDIPVSASELSAVPMSVGVSHWSSSYSPSYEWKFDGAVVSQASSFSYTPGANAQGQHTVVLTIGENNGSGQIDTSKPVKTVSQVIVVSNNVLPTPPPLAVSSPVVMGNNPINTRSLTLVINTGSNKINCATFSSLAITENDISIPIPSAFNISCTQASSQNLSYTLSSAGDGLKTLRLWAMDSSGVISSASTAVNLYLDTAAPSVQITSPLLAITNSTAQIISFVANDNGGTINYYQCKIDTGTWSACSSPQNYSSLVEGDHTFSVKAIDTAGNISNVDTKTWHTDLTLPVITIGSSPNAITNQISSTFAFSATDLGGGSVASYNCKIDGGSWGTCSSPKIDILAAGSHTFSVTATDTAGNISGVSSYSWIIDLSLPTVTLTSNPASLTNSTSASFVFLGTDTGGGSIASYQCAIDGGSFAVCSSPKSYLSLSASAHVFSVKAIDTAGNVGNTTTYNWTVDTTTPMASILSGPSSLTNSTSATYTFSATAPPSGSITGYECNVDAGGWTSCSSPKTYSGLSAGAHVFSVRSIDNNGNRSSASSQSWVIDTTAPVLSIDTKPTSINNLTSAQFSFSATDANGIASYSCKLDSASFTTCSSPMSYSSLAQSSHTFSVTATDSAGNVTAAQTYTWSIDTTAPTLSFTSTPNTVTNLTTASFSFTGSDTGGGALAGYQCSIDGSTYSTCTSPSVNASLAAGAHVFSVLAVDTAGNASGAQNYNWVIDTTAPTLNLTSTPNAITNLTTASFSFTGSDTGGGAVASFACKLDSGSYASCTSPKSYSGLSAGSHSVAITVTDTAGNTSSELISTWLVDLTAPSVAITTPSMNGSVANVSGLSSYTLGGTCSENGITVTIAGSLSGSTTCVGGVWSKNIDLTGLADGTVSLTAAQTDLAGNTTTTSARTIVKDTQAPTISVTTPTTIQGNVSTGIATWSLTETNIAAGTSFTVEVYNGTSWINVGTKAATAGMNTNQSYTLTNYTVPNVDTSSAKIRVSVTDAAGNTTTSQSGSFVIDSAAPVVSSVIINSGATVALSPTLSIAINATDATTGVSSIKIADATGSSCQASYADSNWQTFTNGGGVQTYSYITGFSNGIHQICVWAKDAVGNVSQITTNSNAGTSGVDMNTIRLDQGNPPAFTSLSVTNGNTSSANFGTTTFVSGDTINITFTVTDDSALATNPVSIYMTTDNAAYTLIASSTALGSPGVNQASWTKTYTSYTATTSAYFKLRLVATDANGNTTQVNSAALNSAAWTEFAGNTDIGNGSSSLSATLRSITTDKTINSIAATSSNQIFISTYDGLRKIDPATGIITNYIGCGTTTGIPGTITSSTLLPNCAVNLTSDGNDLYIRSGNKIYLVDTVTNYIKVFAGGNGISVNSTDPDTLKIWAYGALTVDSQSKDLYFTNVCLDTMSSTTTSSTDSFRIQKISQNPSTKTANSVLNFAGNCIKGTSVSGSDALSISLENNQFISAHGGLVFVPNTQTLYFGHANLFKIVNGKAYVSPVSVTTGAKGGYYLSSQNKVFYSNPSKGVYSFAPTASNSFDETVSLNIGPEINCVSYLCRNDGIDLSSAGVFTSVLFSVSGQLGILDNTVNKDTTSRVRVVDSVSNSLQTLAGVDRFFDGGGDRSLAKFSSITDFVYKSNTTDIYNSGIYVAVFGAAKIVYASIANKNISVIAGSGLSQNPTTGNAFNLTSAISTTDSTGALYNLAINPIGFFTYGYRQIVDITSGKLISKYISGTSGALSTTDGTITSTVGLADGEHLYGLLYDGVGNLYFGGYNSNGSNLNRIKVRAPSGALYTVIGNSSNAVSSDCASLGCAQAKSIYSSSYSSAGINKLTKPYDNRFNSGEGRLLFAEGNYLRYVSKAYDPSNSKLGTLTNQSGTAINFGRIVGGAVFKYVDNSSEQIDRVYYVSNDGKLYCYKVSSGADANCNNTVLGPSNQIGSLYHLVIDIDNNGNVYVLNTSMNQILKYTPP